MTSERVRLLLGHVFGFHVVQEIFFRSKELVADFAGEAALSMLLEFMTSQSFGIMEHATEK